MTAALVDDSVTIDLPVKTISETNQREHWAVRHRRRKAQRTAVGLTLRPMLMHFRGFANLNILVTRIGPRRLDTDNLAGSLKAVVDGIADALGVDDGDERIAWLFAQRAGGKAYGVQITAWRP